MKVTAKIKDYDGNFYDVVSTKAKESAQLVLPECLKALPTINSAIDFGCGQGMWLQVIQSLGVKDVRGLDGSWIDRSKLYINSDAFQVVDFESDIRVGREYDLAISLEVAEHISKESAQRFIRSLTSTADFVLFSAAIPLQGGTKHINEQWPAYWSEHFKAEGFLPVDCIRPKVWNKPDVAWFYKQNIILYVKSERIEEIKGLDRIPDASDAPLPLVHPELFQRHMDKHVARIPIAKGSLQLTKRLVKRVLRKGNDSI